jgi:antitoxin component YwqK of YwqJK toxin-antitoxin module
VAFFITLKNNPKMKQIIAILTVSTLLSACQFFGPQKQKMGNNDSGNDSIKIQYRHFNNDPSSPKEWKIPTKLNMEGKYVRHGVSVRYTKSGKVAEEIPYNMNKKEGIRYTYHTTGKVYKEQPYQQGLLTGTCKRYDREGLLTAEYPYKNGLAGIGLKEYTNLGKQRTDPVLRIDKMDEIKSNGTYKLIASLTGEGSERVKKVEYYEGKLIEGKYLHKNLKPLTALAGKKGELSIRVSKGNVFDKELNIVAEITTTTGLKLIMQKSTKVSVRGV